MDWKVSTRSLNLVTVRPWFEVWQLGQVFNSTCHGRSCELKTSAIWKQQVKDMFADSQKKGWLQDLKIEHKLNIYDIFVVKNVDSKNNCCLRCVVKAGGTQMGAATWHVTNPSLGWVGSEDLDLGIRQQNCQFNTRGIFVILLIYIYIYAV